MRSLKKATANLLTAALLIGAVPLPALAEGTVKSAEQEIESVSFVGDYQIQNIPIFLNGMENLSIEVLYTDGSSEIIENGQMGESGIYAEIDTAYDPEEEEDGFCYSGEFYVELYDSDDELLYEDELRADVWNIDGDVKMLEPGTAVSGDESTYFLGAATEKKKYIFRFSSEKEPEETFRVDVKASNGKGSIRGVSNCLVGNWKAIGGSYDHNVSVDLGEGSYFMLRSKWEHPVDYAVQLLADAPAVSEVSVDNTSIPVFEGGYNWWGLYCWPLKVTYSDGSIQHVYGPRGIQTDFDGNPYTHFDDYGNAFVMKLKDSNLESAPKKAGTYPVIIQTGDQNFEGTIVLNPETPETPQDNPATPTQVNSIALNKTSLQMTPGASSQLTCTIAPANANDKTVKWSSSNPNTATVDASGKVKAISGGNAVITATSANGKTAACTVTVAYSITYKLYGGKNSPANPAYYYNQKITLRTPTRKDYAFKGWYTSANFKKAISVISSGCTGNLTVYAKWEKVKTGKAAIKSAKNLSGKKIKVSLKKVSGAKGYEILSSTDKKFKKGRKLLKLKKNTGTITRIKKGRKYYVKARAYKLDSEGKKIYGKYSAVKNVTVRK